ncbi:MAG TPA: xanthine dehydrogenase family protein molybdopterin-binding subunit [Woeseiaceae bacterium]|nr:xanthine dehydrogenase family protein molybdopterin-binding subunit [Woeseiaceae bacterium]
MRSPAPGIPARPQGSLSRRGFIAASAAVAGGLVVGFRTAGAEAPPAPAPPPTPNPFDAYLRIGADGRVTVLSAHMEGGQGVGTGVATLVAEELGADWNSIDIEAAAGNPVYYGNMAMGGAFQLTGGSTAMSSSWHRYRQAGALARQLLVAAAAEAWNVPADEVRVAKGVLSHASGRRGTFVDFVERAAALPLPEDLKLKDPADWRYIGNAGLRRPDTAAKTTGAQDYTIDVRLPGLKTAVLARPPKFGATVKAFDAAAVRRLPGVVDVIETPRGVAVVADTYWQALKGRDALGVEWDESRAETRSTGDLFAAYRKQAADGEGIPIHGLGDASAAFAAADHRVEALLEFPYLAHAAMEPLNAVAWLDDGRLELWGGLQMPDHYQAVAAEIAGVAPGNVVLHMMTAGGFFGRRATPDSDVIVEAVSLAKALPGVPVRVQWSREDDMTGGRYRPMYVHSVHAALGADGRVSAWKHHVVGQSILKGTAFEAFLENGIDATVVEGIDDMPYAIPNLAVRLTMTDVGVPVLWWRSVGHTHTAFAVETVMDDLARLAGRDPVEFRLAHLDKSPRHRRVLELAADKAGWGTPLPAGRHRGAAVHRSFGTYVAQVAEVSVADGEWRVERVVCAVDCGIAVNPDIIRAQVEGSVGFALGAIAHGAITLTGGAVDQDNYDSFRILRMNEMPAVEVHIVDSAEPPTGIGEPGVPPLGPAVANALTSATGKRQRVLPLGARV